MPIVQPKVWWQGDWWNRSLWPPTSVGPPVSSIPVKPPSKPATAPKPNTGTGKPTPSKTLPNTATGLKSGTMGKPKP